MHTDYGIFLTPHSHIDKCSSLKVASAGVFASQKLKKPDDEYVYTSKGVVNNGRDLRNAPQISDEPYRNNISKGVKFALI